MPGVSLTAEQETLRREIARLIREARMRLTSETAWPIIERAGTLADQLHVSMVACRVEPRHPLERVFALLSDPRLRLRWQASLTGVELLDAGEPRVGMRWRERPHGLVPFTLEIAAFEPERHWAERIESPLRTGTLDLGFERLGSDATEARIAVELGLRAGLQWSAWLVRAVLARGVRRDLARAERVLGRAQAPGRSAAPS